MRFRLCSFGHSLLDPVAASNQSWRRTLRALAAARRRWPGGHLSVQLPVQVTWECLCDDYVDHETIIPTFERRAFTVRWMTACGSCGLLVELDRRRRPLRGVRFLLGQKG